MLVYKLRLFTACALALLPILSACAQPAPSDTDPAARRRADWLERQVAELVRSGYRDSPAQTSAYAWPYDGETSADSLYARCAAKLAQDGDVAAAQRLLAAIQSGYYRNWAQARIARAEALNGDLDGATRTARGVADAHFRDWAEGWIAVARLPTEQRKTALHMPTAIDYWWDGFPPDASTLQEKVAVAQWRLGNRRSAREKLRAAAQLRGRHLGEIALLQFHLGDSDGMMATLTLARTAIAGNASGDNAVPLGLGAVYGRIGRAAESKAIFAEFAANIAVIRADEPEAAAVQTDTLARYQALAGDYPAALRTADAIQRIGKDRHGYDIYRSQALQRIAVVEAISGNVKGAWRVASRLGRGEDDALRMVAIGQLRTNALDDALATANRIHAAALRSQTQFEVLIRLVDRAYENGKFARAVQFLRKALSLVPPLTASAPANIDRNEALLTVAAKAAEIGDAGLADQVAARVTRYSHKLIGLCLRLTSPLDIMPPADDLLSASVDIFPWDQEEWPRYDRRYYDTPALALLAPGLLAPIP